MASLAVSDTKAVLSSWYLDDTIPIESIPNHDLAKEAFGRALRTFNDKLTRDPSKKAWLQSLQCARIEDVQSAAVSARERYEDRAGSSNVRKGLASFSQKVLYYGRVLDVFAQHHPEYVSLAWGAMKILFMGVAEQENLLATITEGLNQVADSLPHAEISARLYPIPQMKAALSRLYVLVIKFLIRAFGWYCEGRLLHAYHAITRPAALRYDDLIKHIGDASIDISSLASVSSHVEQRDIHLELRSLSSEVRAITGVLSQLQRIAVDEQTVNASTRIEIQHSFYELKISQVFTALTTGSLLDPQSSLATCRFLRDRRRRLKTKGALVSQNQTVHQWNNEQQSAMLVLRGSPTSCLDITDFCADVVDYLQISDTAVLWTLRGRESSPYSEVTEIDILKNLILQALQIRSAKLSAGFDIIVAQQLPKFLNARSKEDWLVILTAILSSFSTAYIVVDTKAISALDRSTSANTDTAKELILTFMRLLERLSIVKDVGGATPMVKIVLAHYGSLITLPRPSTTSVPPFVVRIGRSNSNRAAATSKSQDPAFPISSSSPSGSGRGLPRRSKKKKRM
ncbi:uncharacterized protein A1O9_12031 [Exophiala aquamarina CBS 119918]|uniref:DUF7708 domain-containing protein n=1 Tax=Exophiala aquamarina CBS 119918 TaxID=1182545 RepID=A0A072NWP3_9EURO|nr:uncharacterized protein A1O9_12031 [Exophiala aquamarina CBS 119918]KEF52041.1 hypothetical protein A1O9_12031 [Exophiala aquamarina CBS 119918]